MTALESTRTPSMSNRTADTLAAASLISFSSSIALRGGCTGGGDDHLTERDAAVVGRHQLMAVRLESTRLETLQRVDQDELVGEDSTAHHDLVNPELLDQACAHL